MVALLFSTLEPQELLVSWPKWGSEQGALRNAVQDVLEGVVLIHSQLGMLYHIFGYGMPEALPNDFYRALHQTEP